MKIHHPSQQIDYMLYETRNQLVSFSNMADSKANILLSISSLLATIAITKFDDPNWQLPVMVLIFFLLGAILFALLAVIPSMRVLRDTKKSVKDPNFNTLFFGDFSLVPYKDYLEHMEDVMNDPDRMYEIQVLEIHSAGTYLHTTKFNYIKYGYIFFFIGILSALGLYIAQTLLHPL